MYLGNWCLSAFLSTFQMLWWNWLCRVIAIESMVTFCTSNWSLPWPCLLLRWRWKLPQSLQSWSAWTERFFSLLDSHMIPIILFAEFTWLVILFCPGWRWSGWVWATTRISGHFSQTTRWFQIWLGLYDMLGREIKMEIIPWWLWPWIWLGWLGISPCSWVRTRHCRGQPIASANGQY